MGLLIMVGIRSFNNINIKKYNNALCSIDDHCHFIQLQLRFFSNHHTMRYKIQFYIIQALIRF
jgi:hypothetical protein